LLIGLSLTYAPNLKNLLALCPFTKKKIKPDLKNELISPFFIYASAFIFNDVENEGQNESKNDTESEQHYFSSRSQCLSMADTSFFSTSSTVPEVL